MSFANTTAHSEWSVNSGKTYVTTGNFSSAFFTYTTSQNASRETIGELTTVATAANGSTSLFGRNHHLVLNGRKLTPGVNPMNSITGNTTTGLTYNPFVYGSTPGAATVTLSPSGAGANTTTSVANSTFAPKFMVGVADIQTGLNGFIDPTNPLFALYDKNRPVADYLVDMATGLSVANASVTVSSGQTDRINTESVVLANIANNNTGTATVTNLLSVGANIGPLGGSSCGKVTMQAIGSGTGTYYFSSSIITPNSIINLTPLFDLKGTQTVSLLGSSLTVTGGAGGTVSVPPQDITVPLTIAYYVTNVAVGSFQIVIDTAGLVGTVTPSFNFLIIN